MGGEGPKRKINSTKLTFWPIISKGVALQWKSPRHPPCCTYDAMHNLWRPLSKKQFHLIYLFLHLHILEMPGQGWPDSNATISIMGTVFLPLRQKDTKKGKQRKSVQLSETQPTLDLSHSLLLPPTPEEKELDWLLHALPVVSDSCEMSYIWTNPGLTGQMTSPWAIHLTSICYTYTWCF